VFIQQGKHAQFQFEAGDDLIPRETYQVPRSRQGRSGSLASSLSDENVLVDLLRVAEHDEANVAHVFLRNALDVGRVTARSFSKNIRELRQPPPINSYCASSAVWAHWFLADVVVVRNWAMTR